MEYTPKTRFDSPKQRTYIRENPGDPADVTIHGARIQSSLSATIGSTAMARRAGK